MILILSLSFFVTIAKVSISVMQVVRLNNISFTHNA